VPTLGDAYDHCRRGMSDTLDELQASLFDVAYVLTAGAGAAPSLETFAELRGVLTALLAQQLDTVEHLVRFDHRLRAAAAEADDLPETDGSIHGHVRPELSPGCVFDDATGMPVPESSEPEPPVFPL
jgi:hypothetical protein